MLTANQNIGYFDIKFGPNWHYIRPLRNFIMKFLEVNIEDKKDISRITMSTSELLENAIKYTSENGIRTRIKKKSHDIEVVVNNMIEKETAEEVIRYIHEINRSSENYKAYIRHLRSLKNKHNKTGIGFARICHEGQATIGARYYEDHAQKGFIEITALFNYK